MTGLAQASDREDAAAANLELSPADLSSHPFAEDSRRKSEVIAAFAAHKGEVTEGSPIKRAG